MYRCLNIKVTPNQICRMVKWILFPLLPPWQQTHRHPLGVPQGTIVPYKWNKSSDTILLLNHIKFILRMLHFPSVSSTSSSSTLPSSSTSIPRATGYLNIWIEGAENSPRKSSYFFLFFLSFNVNKQNISQCTAISTT